MEAQTKTPVATGEYYLKGVMETASGFKLNKDSNFQFYFSYGALDRFGEGQWAVKGNTVVFNSKPNAAQDFVLTNSNPGVSDKINIQLKEMNEALLSHVHCKIKGGGKEQEGMTDENGAIQFDVQTIETIEIIFEFCPEKLSVFTIKDPQHHSFEFKPTPSLMQVFFKEFTLNIVEDGLSGGHPLSDESSFFYKRSN